MEVTGIPLTVRTLMFTYANLRILKSFTGTTKDFERKCQLLEVTTLNAILHIKISKNQNSDSQIIEFFKYS